MSKYYQRKRNLYGPDQKNPFRISRGKIDLFLECPRCFYLSKASESQNVVQNLHMLYNYKQDG